MGITGPAPFGFERRWLSKSFRTLEEHPDIFSESNNEEAQVVLGVGKRQVLAIEYWLKCLGFTSKSNQETALTPLGTIVKQMDPQFEERETWLAIHYQLSRDRDAASTYWFAFRKMPQVFNRRELIQGLEREFPRKSERTYSDAASVFFSIITKTAISSQCEIVSIRDEIVSKIEDNERLSPTLFAYTLMDWAEINNLSTANLTQVLASDGPAKPFSLSIARTNELLDRIQDRYRKNVLSISRTANLNSIAFNRKISPLLMICCCYLEMVEGLDPMEAMKEASLLYKEGTWQPTS